MAMAKRSSRGSDACCLVPPGIHWAIQLHHLLSSMQCSDTPSPYPCIYFLLHVLDRSCLVLGPGPSKDHSVLLDGLSSKVCFSIATAKLKHTLCNHQRHQIIGGLPGWAKYRGDLDHTQWPPPESSLASSCRWRLMKVAHKPDATSS